MRIPGDILDRVRGAFVVAALTSCSHEAKPPPPSPSAVAVTAGVASVSAPAPAPIDPVHYASADEAERLTRLDAEEVARIGARRARLATPRRDEQQEQERRLLAVLGTPAGTPVGLEALETNGRPLTNFGCNACGRG